MRSIRTLSGGVAAVVLALGAAAWGAISDQQFVNQVASGGVLEIELGRYAAEHATDPQVRAFGDHMASDHTKLSRELGSLAQRQGLGVPDQMTPEQRETFQKLTQLTGAAFDEAYMEEMVQKHESAIDAFRMQAGEQISDIDRWAAKTLSTLEGHLKRAQSVSRRVDGTAGGTGAGDLAAAAPR